MPTWSRESLIPIIENGKYFNKNMPDGARLRFMFVHPNKSAANTWLWHADVVKMGNQFILYEMNIPGHFGMPNLWTNGSAIGHGEVIFINKIIIYFSR